MNEIQKHQLNKLVEVARKNKDRIVAVNREYTAYCPIDGIIFPNYEKEYERIYAAGVDIGIPAGYRATNVQDVIGFKEEWAKRYSDVDKLAAASFLSKWVGSNNKTLTSDEAGEEAGTCSEFGIWYEELPLPEDVKPIYDPLEVEAKKWACEYLGK